MLLNKEEDRTLLQALLGQQKIQSSYFSLDVDAHIMIYENLNYFRLFYEYVIFCWQGKLIMYSKRTIYDFKLNKKYQRYLHKKGSNSNS